MQYDQTIQDAKRLLAAMSTNHAEARMASPYGLAVLASGWLELIATSSLFASCVV